MVSSTEIKGELMRLIDQLDKEQLLEVLDEVRWLLEDEETLTEEEMAHVLEGEAELARGDSVSLEELFREDRD